MLWQLEHREEREEIKRRGVQFMQARREQHPLLPQQAHHRQLLWPE